ncbi:MAG: hypothetical protein JRH20_28555 [Deltaproteobacteria bacterium]|nr:hypothetical protein [Deltaproteobacteria bacterium]
MHRLLTASLLTLFLSSSAWAGQPNIGGMKRVFSQMKTALEKNNEKLFKKQWLPSSYAKNLVGGSGLPGQAVFKQGSRKGWYLKAQMKRIRSIPGQKGAPWIVPTLIWSDAKKRALDEIFMLLIHRNKRWMVLGGGEKLSQVEALGRRYVNKKPLAPPKGKK